MASVTHWIAVIKKKKKNLFSFPVLFTSNLNLLTRDNTVTQTCFGRWNRLFLRNMFFAWLQVPSMMITLCFTVPTSWYCTNSSKFWDLGPGYRISVLLSRHTAASSGCLRGGNMETKIIYVGKFPHNILKSLC